MDESDVELRNRSDEAERTRHAWWGDRLAPGWRPHTRAQDRAILEGLGLTGPFWGAPVGSVLRGG